MMTEIKHILIGKDLLLKVDNIVSANLSAKDSKNATCIKVQLDNNTEWTVWANLEHSKKLIRSIPKVNEQFELIENIKGCVLKSRLGRETNLSKEIREILF